MDKFAPEQLERVYVLKSLHSKGVRLSQLARVPLDLDGEYVIFDGKGKVLRTCPDAESAIRAVVSGKGRHPGHTITILGRGNPGRG